MCQACNIVGKEGTCSSIAKSQDPDNECMNGACNGVGACALDDGQVCNQADDCLSSHCTDSVCCNATCGSVCQACNLAGKNGVCTNFAAGLDPDSECNNGACSGGPSCALDNGQACNQGGDCLSGFCADGLCCDSSCGGTCEACDIVGSEGSCTPLAAGQDPQSECAAGACNGGGDCALDNGQSCAKTSDCLSDHCADGLCCDSGCTSTCQACDVAGSEGTCSYVPDGSQDTDTCNIAGSTCDGMGNCKSSNGQACSSESECLSGYCVDAVCCDVTCGDGKTDDCLACSKAAGSSTDGVCKPLAAGSQCRATAGACDVAESCDGSDASCPADAVAAAGTECRSAATECDIAEVCDGSSDQCSADVFAVDGASCDDGDSCATADSCASGKCQPGKNTCEVGSGSGPDDSAGCSCRTVSRRAPRGAKWLLLLSLLLARRRVSTRHRKRQYRCAA